MCVCKHCNSMKMPNNLRTHFTAICAWQSIFAFAVGLFSKTCDFQRAFEGSNNRGVFFCFCKSFPLLFHLSGQPSRRGAICVGVYPLITLEAFRIWFLKRALTVSSDHVLLLLFHPSHSFFSLNCFSEIETIRFFIFTYLSLYFIGFITTFTFHIIVVLVFLHMYTPRLFLSVYHVFCQIQHP